MGPPGRSSAVGSDTSGRITDADIARARAQVGIRTPNRSPKWNPTPDRSSISHFAFGYGDDNPLWHDPEYGQKTRWRDQIAPPLYLYTTGVNETAKFDSPELKKLFKGLFPGVGKYQSAMSWELYRPVYPGDVVIEDGRTTVDVSERPSSFAGGRVVVETYRTVYVGRAGDVFGVNYETYVNAERIASRETAKHSGRERQRYSEQDLEAVDKGYGAEQRRGREPRWWEDVTPGEDIAPVVKGPLTVLDVISHHMAAGWGSYGIGPLRYAWDRRQHMPKFYTPDEYGVPDVVQRLHWDSEWAANLGLPAPYDYGQMRALWLSHLVTNWIGDDGWLWKLSCELRGFNFLGDTQWCTGVVTGRSEVDDHCIVELAIRATNQRGEVTTPGTATVILPSKRRGPVCLPVPGRDLRGYAAEVVAGHTEPSAEDGD